MFDRVSAEVTQVVEADLTALHDNELRDAQSAVQRELARLQSTAARLAAELDARDAHDADGARNAAAWLAWNCRLPAETAAKRVRLGRVLRHLPAVDTAWRRGAIDEAHVSVLARLRNDRTAAALARDEELLVGYACDLSFRAFVRVVRYWSQHADPDGAESAADRQRCSRRLQVSQTLDGRRYGDFALDAVNGAVFDGELQRLYDELFRQDWKEAEATLGRKPLLHELARTPAQRRADALVEMAVRSATAPAGGKRPRPLISLLVGHESFARLCELADGTVVPPGSLASLLGDALVEAAIFAGHGRRTEISHQRTFTGALRRIIELRDRQCFHQTCEEPADRCQVDHIVPFEHGGPTTEQNGRLACPFHNRRRSRPPP